MHVRRGMRAEERDGGQGHFTRRAGAGADADKTMVVKVGAGHNSQLRRLVARGDRMVSMIEPRSTCCRFEKVMSLSFEPGYYQKVHWCLIVRHLIVLSSQFARRRSMAK